MIVAALGPGAGLGLFQWPGAGLGAGLWSWLRLRNGWVIVVAGSSVWPFGLGPWLAPGAVVGTGAGL